MSRMLSSFSLLLWLSLPIGCAMDGSGTPPWISDLALTPSTLSVGQQNAITGTLAFDDPNADVRELAVWIELPDGSQQQLPATDVSNSAGLTTGTVQVTLAIIPRQSGRYRFVLWLVDVAGGESNQLETTAQAQ